MAGTSGNPGSISIGMMPGHLVPAPSQYSSLPRRSSAFQRDTPVRRSTGIMENHIEYFVPRSVSEFNLSGVGDLAIPPPRISPIMISTTPHNLQSQTTATILCPAQIIGKPREKMVTFEDESKCPHGIPATPRKGGIVGGDIFM